MGDEERLVAHDDNGAHLRVVTRRVAQHKGIWHRWCQGWIVAKEASRRDLLFQHRSAAKALYPNLLDVTAGGHHREVETRADGARELQDELGLADVVALIPVGRIPESCRVAGILDREFAKFYLLRRKAAESKRCCDA